jgi:hypothetical protein
LELIMFPTSFAPGGQPPKPQPQPVMPDQFMMPGMPGALALGQAQAPAPAMPQPIIASQQLDTPLARQVERSKKYGWGLSPEQEQSWGLIQQDLGQANQQQQQAQQFDMQQMQQKAQQEQLRAQRMQQQGFQTF